MIAANTLSCTAEIRASKEECEWLAARGEHADYFMYWAKFYAGMLRYRVLKHRRNAESRLTPRITPANIRNQ